MTTFGLIGYPLTHSRSPEIFARLFREENLTGFEYRLFPLQSIQEFPDLIANHPDLRGLNVTIPYKTSIMGFLDHLSPEAQGIGAVNCIRVEYRPGKPFLSGYNTDANGFIESVRPFLEPAHTRALVLGTGGASRAVIYALKQEGIEYQVVSRRGDTPGVMTYQALTESVIREFPVIINTTPVGMFPDTGAFPDIPYEAVHPGHLLVDLIYNPPKTTFLKKGEQAGAVCVNGLKMLELQALGSWKIWKQPS